MTPDDLVEKAARAMFANSELYTITTWEGASQASRDMWLNDARAALRATREALGEVDEGMLAASPLGRIDE
jgi:hypothetical protein